MPANGEQCQSYLSLLPMLLPNWGQFSPPHPLNGQPPSTGLPPSRDPQRSEQCQAVGRLQTACDTWMNLWDNLSTRVSVFLLSEKTPTKELFKRLGQKEERRNASQPPGLVDCSPRAEWTTLSLTSLSLKASIQGTGRSLTLKSDKRIYYSKWHI